MKKITIILLLVSLGITLSSCGKQMYRTTSGGKDNTSYLIVLADGGAYDAVSVVVDGNEYPYGKPEKMKNKRRAQPLRIAPGKHHVQVKVGGQVVIEEDIFIGLQETRSFVLR